MSVRLLSSEQLQGDSLRLARRYQELSRTRGVVVGALMGAHFWDVRPLILEDGIMTLVRFSDPELVKNAAHWTVLRDLHVGLAVGRSMPGLLDRGEAEGQLWYKRRYYSGLLSSAGPDELVELQQRSNWKEFRTQLLSQLEWLHERGFVHGHVCPANCVLDGGRLSLVDFGFFSVGCSESEGGIAPEVNGGGSRLYPASDMFGIGLILQRLAELSPRVTGERSQYWEVESAEQAVVLESLLNSDPRKRPSAGNLKAVLSPPVQRMRIPSPAPVLGRARSGRLLSPQQLQPPPREVHAVARGLMTSISGVQAPPVALAQAAGLAAPMAEAEQTVVVTRERLDALVQARGEAAPAVSSAELSPPKVIAAEKTRGAESSEARPKSGSYAALLTVLGALMLGLGVYHYKDAFSAERPLPYVEYWASGKIDLLRQVAKSAIRPKGASARAAIISSRMLPAEVNQPFLHFVFQQPWATDFNPDEAALGMKVALANLLDNARSGYPDFEVIHPALAVGLLGILPFDVDAPGLSALKTDMFAALPKPYGAAWAELARTGVMEMRAPAARALAHMMLDDHSNETVGTYFAAGGADPKIQLGLVRAVLFLVSESKGLDEALYRQLLKGHPAIVERISWFESGGADGWASASTKVKLLILSGIVPVDLLNLGQMVDLLVFPKTPPLSDDGQAVRTLARQDILKRIGAQPSLDKALQFVSEEQHQFSREQVVSLVLAVGAPAEKRSGLIDLWFASARPDADSLVRLVLLRAELGPNDYFNKAAAAYLNRIASEYGPDRLQIRKLASHPELDVRAYAYTQLSIETPEDLRVLEAAADAEPDAKLREFVSARLKAAREMQRE